MGKCRCAGRISLLRVLGVCSDVEAVVGVVVPAPPTVQTAEETAGFAAGDGDEDKSGGGERKKKNKGR